MTWFQKVRGYPAGFRNAARAILLPYPPKKPPTPEVRRADAERFVAREAGRIDPKNIARYRPLIEEFADQFGFERALVAAFLAQESTFNPNNDLFDPSKPGKRQTIYGVARGMMQVTPAAAIDADMEYGKLGEDRYDVETGVRYLAWIRHTFAPTSIAGYALHYHGPNSQYAAEVAAWYRYFKSQGW